MDKKAETREWIIKIARETFLEKDLFNTAMIDIASSAGLSRRTIYRYFKTKEDLAYEVTIGLLNEWNAYQRGVFNKLEGSGIERLELFLSKLIDHMSKKPDVMRYLSEFDFYFKDESNSANEDSMSRFNEIILESESLLNEIMILGKEDKSIKENLDAKLMVATMSNVLWSFAQRIAIRGEIIKKESGLDGITLIKNQVDIYIMFIRKD